MANVRCDIKNVRPRPIRGFLPKNEVIFADTEMALSWKYIIKAMHQSDVYVNGKLVEKTNDVCKLFENIKVEEATTDDLAEKLANIKEGDIVSLGKGTYSTPITIDKGCIITGSPDTVIAAPITVSAGNVVIDSVTVDVKESTMLTYTGKGEVSLVNCTFKTSDVDSRTLLSVVGSGQVVLDGCVFDDTAGKIYNAIEFSINKDIPTAGDTIIRNCVFKGKSKNNNISFYNVAEGANIIIENCTWDYAGNGIRISNVNNTAFSITVKDCTYKATAEGQYAGLVLFQDFSKDEENHQDFTKVNLRLNNVIGPDGNVITNNVDQQVYYVYEDTTNSVIKDHNQPNVIFL